MMNTKTTALITSAAVTLIFGLFSIEQSLSAQTTRGFLRPANSAYSTEARLANTNCKKLKGTRVDVFDPATGVSFGALTGGGWLNGTTLDVANFGAGFVLTPDPNVITYLSDTTITTGDGQLQTSLVTTFNFVTGVFTQWGNINPNTSTGRFAGATGVIFFVGTTLGNPETGPYESTVVGDICFPNE